MICASVYLLVFIRNLLVHLAEKILLSQPLTFGGDYPGLPVGESLSYGKTAVVSNNSSLPEVSSDLVRYCDPLSPQSIIEAFRDLITDPNQREALEARIHQTQLRSRGDVAEDLILATVGGKDVELQ